MENKILKLSPYYSEKVWGYEKWILSTHKNGYSKIIGQNKNLFEYLKKELPVIVKIIKADEKLSVQVHPDDEYAKKYENYIGKTECWYILDAKKDASLICGIKDNLNKEKLENIIKNNELEENIKRIKVKKGDMIYIPSGTVHAIEEGIELLEIQQSSDITYRLYDWGRERELHIDKSLEVIDYNNLGGKIENFKKLSTPYFNVEKISIINSFDDETNDIFHVYIVIEGHGKIMYDNTCIDLIKYDTIYIKENTRYSIVGNLEIIKIYL